MGRLSLVLNGLDEAYLQKVGALNEVLSDLNNKNYNISVSATSRPEETVVLSVFEPSIVEIDKENVATAAQVRNIKQ